MNEIQVNKTEHISENFLLTGLHIFVVQRTTQKIQQCNFHDNRRKPFFELLKTCFVIIYT